MVLKKHTRVRIVNCITLLLCFLLFSSGINAQVISQEQQKQKALANQYYSQSEYHKAITYYEKLADDDDLLRSIYSNYLQSLIYVQDFEKAEKLCKQAIKLDKLNQHFKVDKGMLMRLQGEEEKANDYFEKLIKDLPESAFFVKQAADAFIHYNQYGWAEKAYLHSRNERKSSSLYFFELSNLYVKNNDKNKLTGLLLSGIDNSVVSMRYVQSVFQRVYDEEDYDELEMKLLQRLQSSPSDYSTIDLLIWLYYQTKDFESALLQAKSYDIKQKTDGKKSYEVGTISMKNEDYQTASKAFEFVINTFKKGTYYLASRKKIVEAKEELIVKEFPIDTTKVRGLIHDYAAILNDYGRIFTNAEIMKRMAVLYAFYLHDINSSLKLLDEVSSMRNVDRKLLAEVKLTKGDLHILQEEPWEAILIFGQVEKENKFSSIAHEAKYKAAELSYFIGEFDLAKSHLDILKQATTKEIANNAIDLSVFIQDNSGLDTTYEALYDYAQAELLVFQNKLKEADIALDEILEKYPGHALTDEVYYKKAVIYQKMGKFEKAIEQLDRVIKNFPEDVVADDAMYLAAGILENNIKDLDRAQEYYKSILLNQPGSIFVNEARERFRKLRGDFN